MRSLHTCLAWKRTHPCRQFIRLQGPLTVAGYRGNGATESKTVIPTRAWISELTFRSTCGTIAPRLGGLPLRSAR